MTEHTISKVSLADIHHIVAFQHALEEENTIFGYRADSIEDWNTRDLRWTLLATAANVNVGFIHCLPRKLTGECIFPPEAMVLEIIELVVQRAHRGMGIGRQLVAAIQLQAIKDGFTHLRLYSAAKRFDDIMKFYRSCGFTPWYLEMTQDLRLTAMPITARE